MNTFLINAQKKNKVKVDKDAAHLKVLPNNKNVVLRSVVKNYSLSLSLYSSKVFSVVMRVCKSRIKMICCYFFMHFLERIMVQVITIFVIYKNNIIICRLNDRFFAKNGSYEGYKAIFF